MEGQPPAKMSTLSRRNAGPTRTSQSIHTAQVPFVRRQSVSAKRSAINTGNNGNLQEPKKPHQQPQLVRRLSVSAKRGTRTGHSTQSGNNGNSQGPKKPYPQAHSQAPFARNSRTLQKMTHNTAGHGPGGPRIERNTGSQQSRALAAEKRVAQRQASQESQLEAAKRTGNTALHAIASASGKPAQQPSKRTYTTSPLGKTVRTVRTVQPGGRRTRKYKKRKTLKRKNNKQRK